MRKIVVVVGGGKTVTFEGEELKISNKEDGLLIVRDMEKKVGDQQLGVFRSWRYWREVDDIGSGKKETEVTYGETDKIRIINKEGLCVAMLYILPDGNLADDSWIHSKVWSKQS